MNTHYSSDIDNNSINMILQFSQQTVIDHMQSLYNMYHQYINSKFFPIAVYKHIIILITDFYNHVFKSLILKDDIQLSEKFNKINHKEICVVNFMFQLSIAFLHTVMQNHNKFNKNTLQDYISDIYYCIIKDTDEKKILLINNFKHQCNALNLDQYDPDKPLFSIKNKDQ